LISEENKELSRCADEVGKKRASCKINSIHLQLIFNYSTYIVNEIEEREDSRVVRPGEGGGNATILRLGQLL